MLTFVRHIHDLMVETTMTFKNFSVYIFLASNKIRMVTNEKMDRLRSVPYSNHCG